MKKSEIQPGCVSNLTHWGRVTHICVGKLTNIGSDNGLLPGRRQAIIWTSAGTLLIGPLGTNFSEILIEILTFSFKKMLLKMSSGKWRPFCLGLNVIKAPCYLYWNSFITIRWFQTVLYYNGNTVSGKNDLYAKTRSRYLLITLT